MNHISIITIFLLSLFPKISYGFKGPFILGQDSAIVGRSNGNVLIDKNSSAASVLLVLNKEHTLNIDKKYSVCFHKVQLKEAPEGVYEIYVSPEKLDKTKLSSKSPFFVNLLDTYGLDNRKDLCINATSNLKSIAQSNKRISTCFVAILFRSNILPNKGVSKKVGKIYIEQIRLIAYD